MWEDILNIVISNGIFAVLFVLLLSYLLKDSSKREQKYTKLIDDIQKNLNKALDIKEETDEIKLKVEETKEQVEKNANLIKKVHAEVKCVKKDMKVIKKIIKPQKEEENNEKQI